MLSLHGFCAGSQSSVHDLVYDWQGRRLAAASADQRIRIFQLMQDADGSTEEQWQCIGNITAHNGPVLRLCWSAPEFGSLLASCSDDRSVHIYQQASTATGASSNSAASLPHASTTSNASALSSTFRRIARISEARDGVTSVAFNPRHHGLKLTTASLDGTVSVYESTDIINLAVWQQVEEFDIRSATAASASANNSMIQRSASNSTGYQIHSIAYNMSAFDPPMLAISSGENSACVWMSVPTAQQQQRGGARSTYGTTASTAWQPVCELVGHTDVVTDVCWSPPMGRSYHLIATACKDGQVRIYKLYIQSGGNNTTHTVTADLVARLPDHHTSVWRVSWNVSGTILCSSGDDGAARMWRQDFSGRWQQMMTAAPSNTQHVNTQHLARPTALHIGMGGENGTGSHSGMFASHPVPTQ